MKVFFYEIFKNWRPNAFKVKKILLNFVEDYLISNRADHSKIHKTYIENINNEMENHIKI